MRKTLSFIVAAALSVPASLAFADEAAVLDARKAGQAATAAGQKAEKAGTEAKAAGEKAEQAAGQAQHSMEGMHVKHATRDEAGLKHATTAIEELQRADPGLSRFFDDAAGYAVFATVGKGAVGIGGAHGTGVLFEKGTSVGETTLTQVTVGLQLGGQSYSEVIFFETEKSLADFKKGGFAMAAQVSAVAASAGASANARYVQGVSVFTLAKGGLMAEASVGGQKFTYRPFRKATVTSSR
jgi:lipid-binding SYLF domain-containing protein